jgi:hypothetical protein
MNNERITLEDTPKSAIIKLAEGNPGALSVMIRILEKGESIDPDAAFGPMAHIFGLGTFGIYGPRIWMLYKDACKQDLISMLAVLRAVQLGKLSESIMNHAIDNYGVGLDLPEILKIVQEQLPDFGKVAV